jgi:hypothetical protein
MAKRIILFIIIVVFAATNVYSQSVLLEKDLNESVYVRQKGPNKKRFFHLYYDYTFYAPEKGTSIYNKELALRNYIGARNNFRIASNYVMGLNLEFGWETFRIEQTSQKTFPSAGVHKKEFLSTTNLGLEYFNRLLITQKEGSLGIWVDAGIYGNLTLGSRHVIKDKADPSEDVRYRKIINKGLKYVEPLEYGVKGRLGYKRYAVAGTYRLSDWLKDSNAGVEPPRFSLGFELGLY